MSFTFLVRVVETYDLRYKEIGEKNKIKVFFSAVLKKKPVMD